MNIPDAAIEAAAEAIARLRPAGEDVCARAAIKAALPAVREAIAQEIEADLRRNADHMTPNERHGQRRSAHIVRGGGI